jgi:hypothetical protein
LKLAADLAVKNAGCQVVAPLRDLNGTEAEVLDSGFDAMRSVARLAKVEEVAEQGAFRCSAAAGCNNRDSLPLDGG